MTIVAANWVGENTSTIGTGPLALSGAISTFCPFSVLPDGSEVYYTLQEGFNRETGIGVVSNGTLTRNVQATLVAGVYTETDIPISLIGNGQVFAVINADFMTRIYNFSLDVADSVSAAAASAQSAADSATAAATSATASANSATTAATSAADAAAAILSAVKSIVTFTTGGTLNSNLDRISDGVYLYYWTGSYPVTVPANSTVDGTGGINIGAWACDTDLPLRQNLGSGDGFKLVGQVPSYAALKTVAPSQAGQRILLASYYANGTTGGGEFMAVSGTATDDGGTVCVPTGSTTWYWQRVSLSDFNVSWFGAIGDSNTANSATNTTAIQNAMNAASSYGIATVRFPASTGFYACGTIYVPAGVTLMGSNRAKSLYGATVYLRKGSNAVVSSAFDGLWTKQSYFRLWDPDNTGSMISNVWFTNCLIDGTNLSLAGKTAGDAIQVKNTTFDVHLKGTYIQNYLGAGYSAVSDNTTTSYLATGVFCTLSQCKIFNCGYGIYIQGAAADSSDYHLDMVLLDHNTINLYVNGTRASGMGECHVYARNCRFEWATTYSIYNRDGFVNFDGWSLAPSSGGQKIYTSSLGKTFINGRFSGVAEGEDGAVDGNLVAHPGIITNQTYSNASPVVPLMLNNTTRGSTLKLQALRFKFQFNGASGFTFQNSVSYVSGNAPRYGIGSLYDTSVSAAVLDTTPVSVGSGNSAISATTQNSGISLIFGGGKKFAFVGMPSINRNTTGTAVNMSIQTDNTGTIVGIVFFNAATGAYVNPLSLTGEIQFSFVMFADL